MEDQRHRQMERKHTAGIALARSKVSVNAVNIATRVTRCAGRACMFVRQKQIACTHLDVNSFPLCMSSCCRAGMPETPSRVSCRDATVSSGFT